MSQTFVDPIWRKKRHTLLLQFHLEIRFVLIDRGVCQANAIAAYSKTIFNYHNIVSCLQGVEHDYVLEIVFIDQIEGLRWDAEALSNRREADL